MICKNYGASLVVSCVKHFVRWVYQSELMIIVIITQFI